MNTMDDLIPALGLSVSPDVNDVKKGEEMLSVLALRPQYYLHLAQVVAKIELSTVRGYQDAFSVRWMASIALKNGVDKFWRRNLCDEERDALTEEQHEIKRTLLCDTLLQEIDSRISLAIAVTIAKIARFDCPDKWADLLPFLIRNVESALQDALGTPNNALLFLYHVTKVLSMKKLPADRAAFRNLAAEAFPIFKQLCSVNYDRYVAIYTNQSPGQVDSDRQKRVSRDLQLTFKMLKKILVNGFSKVRELPQVAEFINLSLCEYLPSTLRVAIVHNVSQKIPECLCKLFHEFVYNDPMSFASFVGPTLKLLMQILFVDTSSIRNLAEKFVLKAVNLFKIILLSEEFQPNETLLHLEHPLTLEARQEIDQIVNPDALTSCVRICVEYYLPMTQSQLESWNEDPESFFIESETGGDSWQTSSTASIASFFVTLIKQNTELTSRVVLEIYTNVIGTNSSVVPADLKAILVYDAVLNAFSLALYDISAKITLNEEFFAVIEQLIYAQNVLEEMKIVRKRVCSFLCQWIDAGFPDYLMERLVKLMLHEFNSEKDPVVLLSVTKTLHVLVDTIDALQESITNHTAFFVSALNSLIVSLEQSDSKAKVLATLTLVIDRTRFDIAPFGGDVALLLENLWNNSNDSTMQFLRASITECLSYIVSGLKEKCDVMFSLVKYIENVCLDDQNEQSINLMLDGLNLLLVFVQNTQNENNDELLGIVPAVLPCLELGSEYVQLALPIISAYALLFKTKLFHCYGERINGSLLSLYRDTSRDLMVALIQTLKTYFQAAIPSDQSCITSSNFHELTRVLLQEMLDQDCSSLVEADLIGIFSRLILEKSQIFVGIISAYAQESQTPMQSVLSRLIVIVCDCIDDIVDVRTRKLTALALIYTMNPANTSVELLKERFAEVFYVCLSCMHDLVDPITNTPDMLVVRSPKILIQGAEQLDDTIEAAHDVREKQLLQTCITSSVSLKDELRNLLTLLRNCPDVNYDELLSSIDENCKLELEKFYE